MTFPRFGFASLLLVAAVFACGGSQNGSTTSSSTDDAGTTPAEDDSGSSTIDDAGTDTSTTANATCPKVGASSVAATVAAPAVTEASGVAISTKNAGVFWVHNDSGDSARAFALAADGKLLATLSFDTKKPDDIEDMAIEDQGGSSFLYFGDIGDNPENRASITIHRVAEPTLGGSAALTATSEKMTVKYVDGAHNAETLLFDPITKDLLIATKKTGGPSAIHRIGAFAAGATVTTTKIAEVDIALATGGEISRDGRLIAIRSYPTVHLWTRNAGETIAAALARPPCTTAPINGELQGESLAFFPDSKRFVTLSEGASPKLNVHALE